MGEELKIEPVSVPSLALPETDSAEVQKIAASEKTPDLDTLEEFRAAALYLEKVGKIRNAKTYPLLLNASRITEEDHHSYVYRAERESMPDSPTHSYLVRRDLETGNEERIDEDLGGCDPYDGGDIEKILVVGGSTVFVTFEDSMHQGWFGKVVRNDQNILSVQFMSVFWLIDTTLPSDWNGIVDGIFVEGPRVLLSIKQPSLKANVLFDITDTPTGPSIGFCPYLDPG